MNEIISLYLLPWIPPFLVKVLYVKLIRLCWLFFTFSLVDLFKRYAAFHLVTHQNYNSL